MTATSWLLLLAGTLLALSSFRKRPANLAGYVYPRYLVPVMFWFVGFLPVLVNWWSPSREGVYAAARDLEQDNALGYLVLCLIAFKAGFAVPLRSAGFARLLDRMAFQFYDARLRRTSVFVALGTFVFVFVCQGPSLFDATWQGWVLDSATMDYLRRFFIFPLNVLAAGLYGLGWPSKEEGGGTPARWFGALVVLLLTSLPQIADFSRSSGLMPALMLIGYMVKARRIPKLATTLVLFNALYCGHVALTGRGVYGHYAGAFPFAQHYLDYTNLSWDMFQSSTGAADSFTPLCVTMQVRDMGTFVGQMSPVDWLIFQIPIPHIAGFGGTYTVDLTYYLGGRGTWGYTVSMFGDTMLSLGWWGCLAFAYMGALYRFLENTVKLHEESTGLGAFALALLPAAYFAFLAGAFNTFRAWNSVFTLGLGVILLAMWLWQKLTYRTQDMIVPEGTI